MSGFIAPEAERDNWGARWARECVERRLLLVRRQLASAALMAGDTFTAADTSVSYTRRPRVDHAGLVAVRARKEAAAEVGADL